MVITLVILTVFEKGKKTLKLKEHSLFSQKKSSPPDYLPGIFQKKLPKMFRFPSFFFAPLIQRELRLNVKQIWKTISKCVFLLTFKTVKKAFLFV